MEGKLYGVGVGPGDPELLTLKAVKILESSDIIAIPSTKKERCVAYKIAVQSVPSLEEKEILYISMPMTKDKNILKKSHEEGAKAIIEKLNQGKKISFITLGDPTIYSTYLYIHRLVLGEGYDTEIISGIPSFCAAAARINEGLVENSDELHVIPASYQISDALSLPGTKVLMKSGKKMNEVREILNSVKCNAVMIENCGMENEKVYRDINDIKDDSSYYSLIIVKEK
ncbi:precorrin-2 C(20)-methyltransferase [Clostridium sp. SHJSY1]|uniref:precorrin-2 C(20)-methyltransferase n=1 Tax=Clostridium sp. SHJSY1 TaxID=2942483 RepID=UPI00287686E0|nr:precorrin-2 C(20)-methyltransferase [Clostridium sp. SHJSY1]MDS0526577.1 precorrin-2 C(20)-methyltransferase [Clostridium sp. SHJSY1]